jgi:chromosome segregation ATPase
MERDDAGDQIPAWMQYKAEANKLRAERDRYMAEASERQQTIGRLEAERDALAAQCAALAEECGANPNDIPAAAARYLAAERVAEAAHRWYATNGADSSTDDLGEAVQVWWEAAGK